eukprot:TRINITY_DN46793_c0_g1_i1.p1 TRINITY_DN46793_c0_g1~~TRINITY_DN46793_c0_g1_i1.p1  ORF type:complete len:453 (+),score=60.20 TRINITY_DN46793_c0_g1_i1:61-1419(+)
MFDDDFDYKDMAIAADEKEEEEDAKPCLTHPPVGLTLMRTPMPKGNQMVIRNRSMMTNLFDGMAKLAEIDEDFSVVVNAASFLNNRVLEADFVELLPGTLKNLIIYDSRQITCKIGSNFLRNSTIKTLVMRNGFEKLTHVGPNFISDCPYLTSIDLNFPSCVGVKPRAFARCTSLQQISFTGLCCLKKLNHFFLAGCTSLTSVDFSPMTQLVWIGTDALANCTSLKHFRMSGNYALQKIHRRFLADAVALETVDISRCNSLMGFATMAFANCKSLRRLDLSSCRNISYLGPESVRNCTALRAFKVPDGVLHGPGCFEHCPLLRFPPAVPVRPNPAIPFSQMASARPMSLFELLTGAPNPAPKPKKPKNKTSFDADTYCPYPFSAFEPTRSSIDTGDDDDRGGEPPAKRQAIEDLLTRNPIVPRRAPVQAAQPVQAPVAAPVPAPVQEEEPQF